MNDDSIQRPTMNTNWHVPALDPNEQVMGRSRAQLYEEFRSDTTAFWRRAEARWRAGNLTDPDLRELGILRSIQGIWRQNTPQLSVTDLLDAGRMILHCEVVGARRREQLKQPRVERNSRLRP